LFTSHDSASGSADHPAAAAAAADGTSSGGAAGACTPRSGAGWSHPQKRLSTPGSVDIGAAESPGLRAPAGRDECSVRSRICASSSDRYCARYR
jgi:hypothetical protein